VRSHLRMWGATVLVVAIGLGGCGKTAAKTDASAHRRAAKAAPAYRVGQYCLSGKEAKYRARGLACRRHHLAGR
jgi:hypothetical protein